VLDVFVAEPRLQRPRVVAGNRLGLRPTVHLNYWPRDIVLIQLS
jgi:hypothetical protein